MQKFMGKDFLLTNKTARKLYHDVAAAQPIFDYHCHLVPAHIAENKRFDNIAEVWLGGDHYKWRQMRSNGIDEKFITGDAKSYEKFLAWSGTVPRLLGNPLYHWTHLELQRYFDIYEPLNETTAQSIWSRANAKLSSEELSVFGIFKKFNVYAVGTTDDPADDLEFHKKIKEAGMTQTKVIPSFRPDKAIHIEKPGFIGYMEKLGNAAGVKISKLADVLEALRKRIEFFDDLGCCASDHALEYPPFQLGSDGKTGKTWEKEVEKTLKTILDGGTVDQNAADAYKTYILSFLAEQYHTHGWAMQLHMASIRDNNSRMHKILGPDTGYDGVHDHQIAARLAALLDLLDSNDKLPKTILYSLNPKDYYTMGTLMGCFQGGGIPGKVQMGSAWWFCDHRDGMEEQMKVLGNLGMLPRFIGMLTDSRSFLSYPRHEYFRRILCNMIGTWAEEGEIPNDSKLLNQVVADISFGNAQRYFTK